MRVKCRARPSRQLPVWRPRGRHPAQVMRRHRRATTLAGTRIRSSFFLIAVGAILYFAVTATLVGIDIQTVGLILMVIGVLGFALTLILMNRRPEDASRREYY